MFSNKKDFPIPIDLQPPLLKELMRTVGMLPDVDITVSKLYEHNKHGSEYEYCHMLMLAVPEDELEGLGVLRESVDGVVSYGKPDCRHKGGLNEWAPTRTSQNYIVASSGNGSFYTYYLSERFWMTFGLTARCIGSQEQKVVFDDVSLPKFGIAGGEVSNEYYHSAQKNIHWKVKNEYLRKYLWMNGACGVNVFFYETRLKDNPKLRRLMAGDAIHEIKPENGWFKVTLRDYKEGIMLQVWATVPVVSCELSPMQSIDDLVWPDDTKPMTKARADAGTHSIYVYLRDSFLEKYEQYSIYDTVPSKSFDRWNCNPAYKGQWSFTECTRVGRNFIKVPIREIYKAKPDGEILHAYKYAVSTEIAEGFDLSEEHIVSKTDRFIEELIDLGDNLSELSDYAGKQVLAENIINFSKNLIKEEGWGAYPLFLRIAQVAPLEMTEQAFLGRCKTIFECINKVPKKSLKDILLFAGYDEEKIKKLGNLKLIQLLLSTVQQLNNKQDTAREFSGSMDALLLEQQNKNMSALFVLNDLRIADAHETSRACLTSLEDLGFDSAHISNGSYGHALDFIFNEVIKALETINREIRDLLDRE